MRRRLSICPSASDGCRVRKKVVDFKQLRESPPSTTAAQERLILKLAGPRAKDWFPFGPVFFSGKRLTKHEGYTNRARTNHNSYVQMGCMQPVVPDRFPRYRCLSSGAELTPASVNPGMPSARTQLVSEKSV